MTKLKSKRSKVLLDTLIQVSKIKQYWHVWRKVEDWLEIFQAIYPGLSVFAYTKTDLCRAIAFDPVLKHCFMQYGTFSNRHGIYFDNHKNGGKRVTAIYCCAPNTEVRRPPIDKKWWETLAKRTPSVRKINEIFDVDNQMIESEHRKKQKLDVSKEISPPTKNKEKTATTTTSDANKNAAAEDKKLSDEIWKQSYWDSGEAKKYLIHRMGRKFLKQLTGGSMSFSGLSLRVMATATSLQVLPTNATKKTTKTRSSNSSQTTISTRYGKNLSIY